MLRILTRKSTTIRISLIELFINARKKGNCEKQFSNVLQIT